MTGLPRGYDEWRTRSPDDQYAIDHPEKFRSGRYKIRVMRTITALIDIDVQASSEDDAIIDAIVEAKSIPLDKWRLDQDDYEMTDAEGPPERDAEDRRYDD